MKVASRRVIAMIAAIVAILLSGNIVETRELLGLPGSDAIVRFRLTLTYLVFFPSVIYLAISFWREKQATRKAEAAKWKADVATMQRLGPDAFAKQTRERLAGKPALPHTTSSSERPAETISGAAEQLAHRHMIALADVFEGWAIDKRLTPEQSAMIIGWAESMRALAEKVGPDWDPPKPNKLSLLGFLGRKIVDD